MELVGRAEEETLGVSRVSRGKRDNPWHGAPAGIGITSWTRVYSIFHLISCSLFPPCSLPSLSSIMPTQPHLSSQPPASKLIRDIRAAHGFDNNQSAQIPAVPELRGLLERALER
jgi:hypothetical protein